MLPSSGRDSDGGAGRRQCDAVAGRHHRSQLLARGARVELALVHQGGIDPGCSAPWLKTLPVTLHHHIVEPADFGRVARLLMRRGVGLVLSGGGARGFAHLGIIRALREAKVPIDFLGGASIGAIIAAGVAMGWSDEEMQLRYRRSFVATNPVNDYTLPFLALTRGKKVSRLLEREYGSVLIEDLRFPYFCVSANLTTGRLFEHRSGSVAQALRASVAIPGVMPPVFHEDGVLVDGAAINNLPVDVMQGHAPGFVIGCDVGADRNFGERRVNIFEVLMHAGMINSTASERAQRELADVLMKPPLVNIDLLNWQAFDRAIQAGYDYARIALDELPKIPRIIPAAAGSCESQLRRGRAAETNRGDARRRLTGSPAVAALWLRMSAQAPRQVVHPLELRRAVLRKVEPIQTHGLDLAARR